MTEPRTIILGGQPISVPALPIAINREAYPICRRLTNGGFVELVSEAIKANIESAKAGETPTASVVELVADEMSDLVELAFLAASAADKTLDRCTFDDWAITPPELLDAFWTIRYQTGGWLPPPSPEEGQDEPGEATGAQTPPK